MASAPAARRRYFDCAASMPMTQACLEAQRDYDERPWAGANPNSLHSSGRAAFAALEAARSSLSRAIGARRPREVVFTGGGSESNALALHGLAQAAFEASHGSRNRVVVSAIEHDSVLACAQGLFADTPLTVDVVPARPDGVVDPRQFADLMGPDVALASVMAVNNETGVVQPVAALAAAAHAAGALFHTDAVQALGRVAVDVGSWGVDAASFAAHKVGGPVGAGALYLGSGTPFKPLTVGGGQEDGRRPGTADVRGAVSFAAAACDSVERLPQSSSAMNEAAALLLQLACAGDDACARKTVADPGVEVAPGFVHLLVPGHQTEGLVLALDDRGFEVSGGSACSSGSLEPSHVLLAMGVERSLAFCALRVTFDHRVLLDDVAGLARALADVCADDSLKRRRR